MKIGAEGWIVVKPGGVFRNATPILYPTPDKAWSHFCASFARESYERGGYRAVRIRIEEVKS